MLPHRKKCAAFKLLRLDKCIPLFKLQQRVHIIPVMKAEEFFAILILVVLTARHLRRGGINEEFRSANAVKAQDQTSRQEA